MKHKGINRHGNDKKLHKAQSSLPAPESLESKHLKHQSPGLMPKTSLGSYFDWFDFNSCSVGGYFVHDSAYVSGIKTHCKYGIGSLFLLRFAQPVQGLARGYLIGVWYNLLLRRQKQF
jgi:hypothetical protein